MPHTPPVRLGIVRPGHASPSALVATIEARVLQAELTRRLGAVLLDLRTDGAAVGPWQPLAHAAWPAAIDARPDVTGLWGATPLTALLGRTIDPAAAEVRARMLAHLGLIPEAAVALDATRLASLTELHLRPTDLWLVARAAGTVATGDAAVDALVAEPGSPDVAALDAALDAIAATVDPAVVGASVAALTDEVAALRARVAELEADQRRDAVETTARLDVLEQERAVLQERLERAQLDGATVG